MQDFCTVLVTYISLPTVQILVARYANSETGSDVPRIWFLITDQPTQCRGPVLFCSLASFIVICNTPRRACRQLHPHRPGSDVMPPPVWL